MTEMAPFIGSKVSEGRFLCFVTTKKLPTEPSANSIVYISSFSPPAGVGLLIVPLQENEFVSKKLLMGDKKSPVKKCVCVLVSFLSVQFVVLIQHWHTPVLSVQAI